MESDTESKDKASDVILPLIELGRNLAPHVGRLVTPDREVRFNLRLSYQ